MQDKVNKDEDVHAEHENEDDHPGFGRIVNSTGGILLCYDCCVEVLCVRDLERRFSVVLLKCKQGNAIPTVHQVPWYSPRKVQRAHRESSLVVYNQT